MPDAPQVHYTYNSLEEAEVWARSLGVLVDYEARLDLANYANELLWRLNIRSLPLPDEIRVDATVFSSLGALAIQAAASTKQGRISINPFGFFWRDPLNTAVQQRRERSWSSANWLHPLLHEAGHALVYKFNPAGFASLRDLTNAQRTVVSGEVSFRACIDGYEFTAEVFAGLMAGKTYSKDVMRWYKSRGGINV